MTPGDTRSSTNLPTYESVPLPDGLVWHTNDEDPVVRFAGRETRRHVPHVDAEASRSRCASSDPDSNGDDFVQLHARRITTTGAARPASEHAELTCRQLATHWAFGADGKTVYYKLDPQRALVGRRARRRPTTTCSIASFMHLGVHRRPVGTTTTSRRSSSTCVKHDDHTISVDGVVPKPQNEMLFEYRLSAARRGTSTSSMRIGSTTTTGASSPTRARTRSRGSRKATTSSSSAVRELVGRPELKYYKNRFNVDTIRLNVIRDTNVAYEYFLRGELDRFLFVISPSALAREGASARPFDKGYIQQDQVLHRRPAYASQGMWLNMDDPILADQNVRLGLAYSMNVDAMLNTVLRGDYERLKAHYEGLLATTRTPTVEALPFDLAKADELLQGGRLDDTRAPTAFAVKDGQRLAFSDQLRHATSTRRGSSLLREEARKAGVELNLQLQDLGRLGQADRRRRSTRSRGWRGRTASRRRSGSTTTPRTRTSRRPTTSRTPTIRSSTRSSRSTTRRDRRARRAIRLAHEIEQRIADMQPFIPMYKVPYVREAYWRWMKLPERARRAHDGRAVRPAFERKSRTGCSGSTRTIKAETLEARGPGRAFDPIDIVDETWRVD